MNHSLMIQKAFWDPSALGSALQTSIILWWMCGRASSWKVLVKEALGGPLLQYCKKIMFYPRSSLPSCSFPEHCLHSLKKKKKNGSLISLEKYLLYSRLEHTKLKFPHFPTSHFLGRLLFFSLGHLHRPLLEFKSLYKKFGLTKLTKLFKKKKVRFVFLKTESLCSVSF